MPRMRAAVSWSGGKDSCLAMHRCRARYDIAGLITMLNRDGDRSRSHGLRPEVLALQAKAMSLPSLTAQADWDGYTEAFAGMLARALSWNITHVIFGDVYTDSHRVWAEDMCRRHGLTAVEPLWADSSKRLVKEFLELGGRARITTVRDAVLESSWLGRCLSATVLDDFEHLGIDPAGERGEYHTVVTYFPGFDRALELHSGGIMSHGGCHLLDLIPAHTV